MTFRIETITVETAKIVCIGDKDCPHPRVYLAAGAQGFVDCPYCSKCYRLKEVAHDAATP